MPGHDFNAMPRLPLGRYLKLAYDRHPVAFSLAAPCHDLRELFAPGVTV